jgi:hypothetical protein
MAVVVEPLDNVVFEDRLSPVARRGASLVPPLGNFGAAGSLLQPTVNASLSAAVLATSGCGSTSVSGVLVRSRPTYIKVGL